MWIVTGPFDGETSNEVGFQSNIFSLGYLLVKRVKLIERYLAESKLLKSGKSYIIGRKATVDLVVNHKKVSHDHGQFIVGGFSPDDIVREICFSMSCLRPSAIMVTDQHRLRANVADPQLQKQDDAYLARRRPQRGYSEPGRDGTVAT
jgi:hypothetical protein